MTAGLRRWILALWCVGLVGNATGQLQAWEWVARYPGFDDGAACDLACHEENQSEYDPCVEDFIEVYVNGEPETSCYCTKVCW